MNWKINKTGENGFLNCYEEILGFYEKEDRTVRLTKLWCHKELISLMDKLTENPYNMAIRDCLILIINLFFVDAPDHYHLKGKPIKALTTSEKNYLLEILRREV